MGKSKPVQQELTPRQRQVKGIIAKFSSEHGYPPSYKDIAAKLKVNPSAVFVHVRALERKGHLSRVPGSARSLVVVN